MPTDELIPISSFFFDDDGPHVVHAGFTTGSSKAAYTPARGQELRQILSASITQLGAVSGGVRRKTPVPVPPTVPIETLLYRGRAALDRALELREEILSDLRPPDQETVKELLDLIALAATE